MAANQKPDFSGWVTRYNVKCTDGRTILAHAFKHNNGQTVPLVWQHLHNDPNNVLGHLDLQHRDEGVWVDGYFNGTEQGQHAKQLVIHKDIKNLSIYANGLVQQGQNVTHGNIREGSLVLAGANPGACIDPLSIQHADGSLMDVDDEGIIYLDNQYEIVHGDSNDPAPNARRVVPAKPPMPQPSAQVQHTDQDQPDEGDDTVQEVLDSMTERQRTVALGLVGAALNHSEEGEDESDAQQNSSISHNDQEGGQVPRNVFDQTAGNPSGGATLTHSDVQEIFSSAHKGGSLKQAVEEWALAHGIDDIATLFPYDQAVTDTPEFISRRMEWVAGVLGGVHRTPFSRIRSWSADITLNEARAKGYVKGNLKKEEYFRIARRITTPQTIYKKQKLDRDDILDITEFDVVQWLQTEMRIMLDEELARAILIGDGRDVDDPDKIDTSNVRPIYGDDELYVTQVQIAKTAIDVANTGPDAIVDGVVNAMRFYRGSGDPTMFTTRIWLAKMLLAKDTLGRRLYPTQTELSAALGVNSIIACEALESAPELIGIIVNLKDYTVGADKGGEVSMFDQFDIDYNQFKYLMECRMSGAMTKYRGALAVVQFTGAGGLLADPLVPTFDDVTGVGTIPDSSGLHYTYVTVADDGTESSALTAGDQAPIAAGAYVTYRAVPASTYEFATEAFSWTFHRDS
jgi:hypothetical protein